MADSALMVSRSRTIGLINTAARTSAPPSASTSCAAMPPIEPPITPIGPAAMPSCSRTDAHAAGNSPTAPSVTSR
jgi:hypothetical protein